MLKVKLVEVLVVPATVLVNVPLVMVRAVLATAVLVAENELVTFETPGTAAITVPLLVPTPVGENFSVKVAVPATLPVAAGTVIGLAPM